MHADVAVDSAALAAWLSELLGADVDERALAPRRPSGGGWSNDTLFVDVSAAPGGRVVVRLAPTGPAMFPGYDLGRQVLVMRSLAAAGMVPVARVLGADPVGGRLGRPAFVMGFVGGRVPSDDRPTFAEVGFLVDAGAAEQRRFHEALVDAVAAVHRTPLVPALVGALGPAEGGSVVAALEDLQRQWDFDRGDRWSDVVDEGLSLLRATAPVSTGDVLLWGDARPANVIVATGDVVPVALLDWELASVGPPELDVTWLAEMNRMRMEGSGVARLPGFLDDDAAVARDEVASGRTLADLGWFRLFAAARIAVLMHRHLRVTVHAGQLRADHRLLSDTVATRRLAELIPASR